MTVPTVTIGRHRGKVAFRWKINRRPYYRVVEQPGNAKATEKQRAALVLELMAGPQIRIAAQSLTEHVDDWAALLKAKHSKRYSVDMERRLRRIITATKIKKLADLTIDKVELALANDKVMSALSEQSRNHHRMTVKQFSRWVWLTKRHHEHALAQLRLPKARTQPRRRDRFQAAELQLLITSTESSNRTTEYPGPLRAWLYRLAAVTGLRRGELAALTPACFDIAQKVVRVAASYTKNGHPATCPLPSEVLPELSRWLSGHGREQTLFPGLCGRRVSSLLHRDMKDAGIPVRTAEGRRSFHSLRNSYISALWDAGLPGVVVQRLARH